MNQFSSLDLIFPCGESRMSGEVVAIAVEVHTSLDRNLPSVKTIWWKRKAWYVNASVNAFHLHRGLCRELRELISYQNLDVSDRSYNLACKHLARFVYKAYVENSESGEQKYKRSLYLPVKSAAQIGARPVLYTYSLELGLSIEDRLYHPRHLADITKFPKFDWAAEGKTFAASLEQRPS